MIRLAPSQFELVKSSFCTLRLLNLAHNSQMMLYCSSDYSINFPHSFATILTIVKKQQEAWELIELKIKNLNNLMDENLSWIQDSVDTFCQELQDSMVYISSNTAVVPTPTAEPAEQREESEAAEAAQPSATAGAATPSARAQRTQLCTQLLSEL